MIEKAKNVTAQNYLPQVSRFLQAQAAEHGGKHRGVMLARETVTTRHGEHVPGNETAWYQWMTYFKRKHIPHAEIERRGYVMVPTTWPEEFDGDLQGSLVLAFPGENKPR